MNYLRLAYCSVWLVCLLAAPASARGNRTTIIAHLRPGTTEVELQRQLGPAAQVAAWMPQINAAVLSVNSTTVQSVETVPQIEHLEQDGVVHPSAAGPDPLLSSQYALSTTHTLDAWKLTTGAGTVVAVIDSGAKLDHPDLKNQLWQNPGETPGDGIDNDKDGYIDDINGWHWYHDVNGQSGNDADISDGLGHGTHVAGIIGAERNNAEGGAGVAPDSKLMILRVFGRPGDPANEDGYESDIAQAILYATAHHAAVINLSLGGDLDIQVLHDAIDYAVGQGVVVVAAAGNNGNTTQPQVLYPARYPDVIAVASTDQSNQRAYFSATGAALSLSAPGVAVLSTSLATGTTCNSSGTNYGYCSGTSMSAPFVAGAALLIRSVDPTASPGRIRDILERTSTPLNGPCYSTITGWGLVNIERALTQPNAVRLCNAVFLPSIEAEPGGSDPRPATVSRSR